MFKLANLLSFSLLVFGVSVHAEMLAEPYRGSRAMAMGNAFVGLADDEEAVWYNPAGLAGNNDYVFHYLAAGLALSRDTLGLATTLSSSLSSPSANVFNSLMGQDIYVEDQLSSTLLLPNFGISAISDGQLAIQSKNKALPQIMLGYQNTNGFQMAYGFSVGKKSHRKKGEWRFGIAAKMLSRRGGYSTLPLNTVLAASAKTVNSLGGNYGTGYGVDLGTQYVHPVNKQTQWSLGMAVTNVGGLDFGAGPEPIAQNVSIGSAVVYTLGIVKLTSTYDLRHLLDTTDFKKKSHFGVELGLPFINLDAGVDQVYVNFGASVDIWMCRVSVLSYEEENGSFVGLNPERRYSLSVDLKFNL